MGDMHLCSTEDTESNSDEDQSSTSELIRLKTVLISTTADIIRLKTVLISITADIIRLKTVLISIKADIIRLKTVLISIKAELRRLKTVLMSIKIKIIWMITKRKAVVLVSVTAAGPTTRSIELLVVKKP